MDTGDLLVVGVLIMWGYIAAGVGMFYLARWVRGIRPFP